MFLFEVFFSIPFKIQVVLAQKILPSLILKDTVWNAVFFMAQLKALILFLKSYMKKSLKPQVCPEVQYLRRVTYANFY